MRESIKQFVSICAETLPIRGPIYEFGSMQVEGQVGWADLRPLFDGIEYVGADYREGPGVDVVLDLHEIDLGPEIAGTVMALDTLEHVEYPHIAMSELHRILRPGGIAIVSSVMNFPIHDYPYDFWRFTPAAFSSLLKDFEESIVESVGREDFPQTVVGIGFKSAIEEETSRSLAARFSEWKARWDGDLEWPKEPPAPEAPPKWKAEIKKRTPPKALDAYRRLKGRR